MVDPRARKRVISELTASVDLRSIAGADGSARVPSRWLPLTVRLLTLGMRAAEEQGISLKTDYLVLLDQLRMAAESEDARRLSVASATSSSDSENLESPKETWTVSKAADWLGCSKSYVKKLCQTGRLDAVKIGRDWQIDRRSAERFGYGE